MQYKVLIVEDDADIVELLTLYLNSHDFQVFSAFNGMDALKIVREQDISVALVDVMMPRMNGYEFIKTVRLYTSFPIILISAKTMDEDEVLGLNLGADAYIKKPFNPLVVAQVKGGAAAGVPAGRGLRRGGVFGSTGRGAGVGHGPVPAFPLQADNAFPSMDQLLEYEEELQAEEFSQIPLIHSRQCSFFVFDGEGRTVYATSREIGENIRWEDVSLINAYYGDRSYSVYEKTDAEGGNLPLYLSAPGGGFRRHQAGG